MLTHCWPVQTRFKINVPYFIKGLKGLNWQELCTVCDSRLHLPYFYHRVWQGLRETLQIRAAKAGNISQKAFVARIIAVLH